MIKSIIIFLSVLVFIIGLQVFIMGGWYNQTMGSKGIASFIGIIFGVALVGLYFDFNKDK